MRLTLRTLLAYLDQTLEPQDAEILARKIEESGFATELVARVRRVIADSDLAAPTADAVGPLEDANVIGEYLDSTLTPEQVAEVERACLESDAMLGEAAACHQILTMVLGKPVPVPAGLRERIQSLPDAGGDAHSPSYSSLSIPPDPVAPVQNALNADAPAADPTDASVSASGGSSPAGPVTPVGPADSGVSDAPTRIRETAGEAASPATPGVAGRRATSVTDFYGGSIRPSRIAPWLVSLALAAVLLFALAQIFVEPLMNRRKAADADPVAKRIDSPEASPGDPDDRTPDERTPGAGRTTPPRSERAAPPAPDDTPDGTEAQSPRDARTPSDRQPTPDRQPTSDDQPTPDDEPTPAPPEEPRVMPPGDPETPTPDDQPPEPMPEPGADETPPVPQTDPPQTDPPETDPFATADTPGSDAPADPADGSATDTNATSPASARLLTDDSILIVRHDEQPWRWWNEPDTVVPAESTLICPPFERIRLMAPGNVEVTLVGPTRVRIERREDGQPTWRVESGRLRLTATAPDAMLRLAVPLGHYRCEFPDAKTEVAVEVTFDRDPGLDPRVPENREPIVAATGIGGVAVWSESPVSFESLARSGTASTTDPDQAGEAWTLDPGWQWHRRGDAEATRSEADPVPLWADADPEDLSLIETNARDGLRELIGNEPSFEMSLREAIAFRRVEVGALAARTLLLIGMPDVYFGGDGVLNQDRHRNHWTEHVDALRRAVDRDAEAAAEVDAAIERMASAERDTLFRLLIGFTQQDLKSGADEALVAMLDSPSMAIRVLAIETLRQITGTSLYYKAWESNPTRRDSDVKRWQVRLRRDMIRWPEEQPNDPAAADGDVPERAGDVPERAGDAAEGDPESIDPDAEATDDDEATDDLDSPNDPDSDDGAEQVLGDDDASAAGR